MGKKLLRLIYVDPATLGANPANWRIHPQHQRSALRRLVADVGWAGALLYNERTKRLIDGHVRKEEFAGQKVPVLVGSWTEEQEKKILATLHPLADLAETDADALAQLLHGVDVGGPLQELLSDMADMAGEIADGWGQTLENRGGVPKAVVATIALHVADVNRFNNLIASVALPGERPIDTVLRGLDAINT